MRFFEDFITLKRLFINMYIFDIFIFFTESSRIFIIHLVIYFQSETSLCKGPVSYCLFPVIVVTNVIN